MEVAATASAIGTGISFFGSLEQGKEAQEIANMRAAIDRKNAEYAMRQSREKARMVSEYGEKVLASQRSAYAAGNVRVDTGAPLVVAAQTRKDILKDIGYIIEGGEAQRDLYLSHASIEEATGRHLKRKSRWDAFSTLFSGIGNVAALGYGAGWWGGGGRVPNYSTTYSNAGVAPYWMK